MKLVSAAIVSGLLCGVWVYKDPGSAQLLLPLLIAGALGGVAQSLIENKNTLVFPGVVDSGRYNLGFVADILLGMVGAFASLVVGLGVLNERFFHEPVPTDAGTPKALADFVQVIPAWMRIASFGTLTGFASRRLLPDLSNKVADMVSGALQQELKKQSRLQVENSRTQAELLGMVAEAARPQSQIAARTHPPGTLTEDVAPAPAPVTQLAPIVEKYMAIEANDAGQRLQLERERADEILAMILRLGISAQDILAQIEPVAADCDGWLLALASLIAVAPNAGDGARLLGVASLATQKFVKYRVLLALYSLQARRMLADLETTEARQFTQGCLRSDDPMLKRKAEATLDFFDKTELQ